MKIILARHAQTGAQYQGRYIGSTNLPISQEGERQSLDLADRLKNYGVASCLVSPMLRTSQTAEIVLKNSHIPWQKNDLLKEIDFGAWEAKSFAEISQEYPLEVEKWATSGDTFQFPGGDKTADFWSRMTRCAAYLSSFSDSPLLVVTHGGVIRALICYFLGLPFESYLLFDVKPARFAVVEIFSEGGILSGLNL